MTSREAIDLCEIDVLFCKLSYGVSPCTAAVGVTGERPCYNTRATCQDPDNLDLEPITWRFAKNGQTVPVEWDAIPSLVDVQHSPATVSIGKSLGERASVTFVFRDHQWGDAGPGLDKYWSDRPYDPAKRGTFWGKVRARHRALRGRSIRWKTGFVGQTLEEMETRHYVVESVDGPLRDGTFRVVAKDILKLADGDRSQTPPLTTGALSGNLAINGTSFTAVFPLGFDENQYPTAQHYVAIGGNEILSVTRSGSTFTVVGGAAGRAQFGTTAVAHSAGDRIQLCRYYEAAPPSEILSDILINDCKVDPSFIPLDQWEQEEVTYLQRVFTRCIAEPLPSRQVINDLIEQAGLSVWSDETAPAIRMQVIRGIPSDATVFSPETNILAGSMSFRDQPDTRVSRCITRFALRHPLLRTSEPQSFRAVRALVDGDSELIYGSAAIREIQGAWIPQFGDTTADRTNELQTGRFAQPPRRFQFKISRVGGVVPYMGMGARLRWPGIIQDETGADTDTPIQLTRVKPGSAYEIEAEEMLVKLFDPQDVTNRKIIINTDNYNLNLLTIHNSLYPPLTDEDVMNGVNLTLILVAGITIGSISTSTAALIIPAGWPTGFPIYLDHFAHIRGHGGPGAAGVRMGEGKPGGRGGPALRVRHPIFLRSKAGSTLWSGGGGGGSGGGIAVEQGDPSGRGGGGAGIDPGTPNGGTSTPGAGGSATGSGNIRRGAGGTGGGPGLPGSTGQSGYYNDLRGRVYVPGGIGGAAGWQIDGASFVTVLENDGDRRGPTTN